MRRKDIKKQERKNSFHSFSDLCRHILANIKTRNHRKSSVYIGEKIVLITSAIGILGNSNGLQAISFLHETIFLKE